MTIITDNYIWFLISGGVLLLITIGYFAEQTNFGKKKIGESVNNVDNNSSDLLFPNEPINNNLRLNDVYDNSVTTNDGVNNSVVEPIMEIPDGALTSASDNSISEITNQQNNIIDINSSLVNAEMQQDVVQEQVVGDINSFNSVNIESNEQDVDLTGADIWKF